VTSSHLLKEIHDLNFLDFYFQTLFKNYRYLCYFKFEYNLVKISYFLILSVKKG